jgi:flagellum-specific ATP synthase
MMDSELEIFLKKVEHIAEHKLFGRVTSVKGLLIECAGLSEVVSIGSRCRIIARDERHVVAEVIGFKDKTTLLMPFTEVDAIGAGCKVLFLEAQSLISPDISWLGRVINAVGEPIDDKGAILRGDRAYPFKNNPPPAHKRKRVSGKLDVGVKAINTFISCCRGQRMGIFAGSGVGKSVLISMLTRYADTDVKVIGLIGERGREVQEFLEEYLGEEGLKKAVVIVATGDESALMRRQAAYMTLSVAEYFRDIGKDVLCLMDSVTRFAMAQREIGLSAGEPPTAKGYTPTVFAELPKLLERAGPGMEGQGSITGLFSVLVDGDDHNEPIADAVRGILDGHIVLERAIAERGRFPAINILKSISRTMPGCNNAEENALVMKGRRLLATYNDMAEMIRLGAYRKGSDPEVDNAIRYFPAIEAFLSQSPSESKALAECYMELEMILAEKQE